MDFTRSPRFVASSAIARHDEAWDEADHFGMSSGSMHELTRLNSDVMLLGLVRHCVVDELEGQG